MALAASTPRSGAKSGAKSGEGRDGASGKTDRPLPDLRQYGRSNLDDDAMPEGQLWDWAHARRGLRLRTVVNMRWGSIVIQLIAVLYVAFGLHYTLPLLPCLAVIAVGAWMNLSYSLSWPGLRLTGHWEAVFQLGFDLLQRTVLLAITGGITNPFFLMLVAPVVVAAATLPARHALALGVLSICCAAVLFFWSLPLPWIPGEHLDMPWIYRFLMWSGLTTGIVFNGIYAWQASAEASRMELALATTQAVLSREQRLSALGGLAASAAHELGTPLATIQVVTKEMLRASEPGTSLHDDVQLLADQAERCRDILRRLSRSPEAGDAHHARMSLTQLLDEVADPHRDGDIVINCEVACAPGAAILEVQRLPEVLHGLSAFVENAVDFAVSAVELVAFYDDDRLIVEVRDDGPGFQPEVLARLGEPYVTTRSQGEGSRSHHLGMGLGFFIAKTLLERTGAHIEFRNARRGGALVSARWSRGRIEAPPAP